MGFGESISALLDTYSNCLDLLKMFKQKRGDDHRDDDQHSLLRRSLRSNRAKVQRAYSSRLSEADEGFAKGDAQSSSALRRILKKLGAAIANIMRVSSENRHPVLDYSSLMSLSNSSRIEAVQAMDSLSNRMGHSSRQSLRSTSTKGTSKSKSARSSVSRRRSSGSTTESADGSQLSSHATARNRRAPQGAKTAVDGEMRKRGDKRSFSATGSSTPHEKTHGGFSRTAVQNRISMASVSTDSTKLGEIPQRKWQARHSASPSGSSLGEYSIPATYPLKPFVPEVKEKKLWGFFRRRNEDSLGQGVRYKLLWRRTS